MNEHTKNIIEAVACLAFLLLLSFNAKYAAHSMSNLETRLNGYAYAIDYYFESPERIYPYFTQDFKEQMSEQEFVECFNKERSYPYITGLYISKPEIDEGSDLDCGSATYDQAARIIGMKYNVKYKFENNDYYIYDFEEFLDGSYLDKFDTLSYSLDWYYDPDNNTK